MGAFQVNKDLIPIKVHYFLLNGAHAGVLPFITVYAKQMGISADAIGLIMAILCCLTVISRPLIGSVADHLQKLKLILIALIFIDISADMGLNFIPSSKTDKTLSSVVCHENVSYIFQFDPYVCENNSSSCDSCILSCDVCQDVRAICLKNRLEHSENSKTNHSKLPFECLEEAIQNCQKDENSTVCAGNEDLENSSKNPLLQLCFLSIFTGIIYICNGSIVSLSDAACFNALGTKPELYGRQRLWGTIGWGFFALLSGYLNQVLTGTTSGKYNFSAGFYMLVLLLLTDLLVVSKLKLKDVKASKNIFKDVGMLIVKPRIAIFILQVYFVGIFIGISRSYVFWYLRSLHASQLILGFSSAFQCFLGELPFFFFARWIISKIGQVNTFTMSFVAGGLKFFCYSFIRDPWLGLPIEFLQGPFFGTFYTAMTSYAKIIAPEGTEATVQGLASGTFEGIGVATGSLLGGYAFRTFGGRSTFFWTGIISFAFGVINWTVNYIMTRNRSEYIEK